MSLQIIARTRVSKVENRIQIGVDVNIRWVPEALSLWTNSWSFGDTRGQLFRGIRSQSELRLEGVYLRSTIGSERWECFKGQRPNLSQQFPPRYTYEQETLGKRRLLTSLSDVCLTLAPKEGRDSVEFLIRRDCEEGSKVPVDLDNYSSRGRAKSLRAQFRM